MFLILFIVVWISIMGCPWAEYSAYVLGMSHDLIVFLQYIEDSSKIFQLKKKLHKKCKNFYFIKHSANWSWYLQRSQISGLNIGIWNYMGKIISTLTVMNIGARACPGWRRTLPWRPPGVLGQLGGVSAPFLPENIEIKRCFIIQQKLQKTWFYHVNEMQKHAHKNNTWKKKCNKLMNKKHSNIYEYRFTKNQTTFQCVSI